MNREQENGNEKTDEPIARKQSEYNDMLIDVDVPLTEDDLSNNAQIGLPHDEIDDRSALSSLSKTRSYEDITCSSTPLEPKHRKASITSGKDSRQQSKEKKSKKMEKRKTARPSVTADEIVPAVAIPPELPFEPLKPAANEISRPASRSSKASSLNDVTDVEFLNKYKQLKLLLKEKQTEVARLEEESREAQEQRELERLEKENIKSNWRSWQKKMHLFGPKDPDTKLPDPSVTMKKHRQFRVFALAAMGVALTVMPIVTFTLLAPLVIAR